MASGTSRTISNCSSSMARHTGQCSGTNVGKVERLGSVFAGTSLAAYGATKGGALGWGTALAGCALVWRGLTGWCQLYEALGINTAEQPQLPSLSREPLDYAEPDLRGLRNSIESPEPTRRAVDPGQVGSTWEDRQQSRDQFSRDGAPRRKFRIGDIVWDSTGNRQGKVIGIEQSTAGTIDPSNPSGITYAVQWQDTRKGQGHLHSEDLRSEHS